MADARWLSASALASGDRTLAGGDENGSTLLGQDGERIGGACKRIAMERGVEEGRMIWRRLEACFDR